MNAFSNARIVGGFETRTGVTTGSPVFTAREVLEGRTLTPAPTSTGWAPRYFAHSPATPRLNAAAVSRCRPIAQGRNGSCCGAVRY